MAIIAPGVRRSFVRARVFCQAKQVKQVDNGRRRTLLPKASASSRSGFWGLILEKPTCSRCRMQRSRARRCTVRAMINVDVGSPSLVLGCVLIGCSVILLQLRQMDNKMSRDGDIVVAAMISIVGGTLIFQGWRLDPLLLLCQALTTAIALWYGLEAFKSRGGPSDEEKERRQSDQQAFARGDEFLRSQMQQPPQQPPQQVAAGRPPGYALPPSDDSRYAPVWGAPQDVGAWPGSSGEAAPMQQAYPWAQQPQQQPAVVVPAAAWASRSVDEDRTIRYDPNGNVVVEDFGYGEPAGRQQPSSSYTPAAPYDDSRGGSSQQYGGQQPQNPYLRYWDAPAGGQYGLAVQRDQQEGAVGGRGGPEGGPPAAQQPPAARPPAADLPAASRRSPRTFDKVDDWE